MSQVVVGVVDGENRLFRTERPYFPGTLRVKVNGVDVITSAYTELDPLSGYFQFHVPPVIAAVVEATYSDAVARGLYPPGFAPVHIKDLGPGAQLRIAMKPGCHLERSHTGLATTPRKKLAAKSFSRTTFFALLTANEPAQGRMSLDIQDTDPSRPPFRGIIEYKNILSIQKVIPSGRLVQETAPLSHPGARAMGTRIAQLFQQPYLVPVHFVGG